MISTRRSRYVRINLLDSTPRCVWSSKGRRRVMLGRKKKDDEEEEFSFGDVDTSSFGATKDDRKRPPWPSCAARAPAEFVVSQSPVCARADLAWLRAGPEEEQMSVGRRATAVASSMFGKPATFDQTFEIQKTIQLGGTADAPLPQMDFLTNKRELDKSKYPGAEFFTAETGFLAVDGVPPNERTTAAANALRSMMGAAGTVAAAVTELQQAAAAVTVTLGRVGTGFEASTGGVVGSDMFAAIGPTALPPLERGMQAVRAQAEAGAREVEQLRVAATERQTKFGQFEQVRQEVLGLLQRPSKGVGAVAKMQLKDEALRTVHAAFVESDNRLVDLVNAKQAELGALFGKVISDATQLLAQFCGQTAQIVKAKAAPASPAQGQAGAGRAVRINRQPGAGLGIILKTTRDGNAICEVAQGAAAAAGVVAGCIILAVAGVPVEGRGEGAVVSVIKGLPANTPVDMVLRPPQPNWQSTLR